MKPQHTPWKADEHNFVFNSIGQIVTNLGALSKNEVSFILQAVNSHYELIEACKKIGDYCHRLHFQDVQLCFRECNQAGCIEIKKALALAGVKA